MSAHPQKLRDAPGGTGQAPERSSRARIPDFPLRVACVDTGSNAIRFMAAEFSGPDAFTTLEYERVPVRLGHQVFLNGMLAPESMEAAVDAFRGFRSHLDALEVRHFRAVATSAVREARNGPELVESIRQEAGIDLDVITGSEEARLVHRAVARRIDLQGGQWMLVDLGGGSVEVSLVDDLGILWSESHTMGSVRLLEELSEAQKEPGRFQRLLEEYVQVLRIPDPAQYWEPSGFIATGGNIESLAELAAAPLDERGVRVLPVKDLASAIELLARLSYRERMDELGLREDRADVILPAATVYLRLARVSGSRKILVPDVGIKDGLLLDLVADLTSHESREELQERQVAQAALSLGRRYMFDESHGRQVARLALSLLEQLQDLHGLGPKDRQILLGAAILHDVGQFIAYEKHHKHSRYLISRAELPGLSDHDMLLMGHVARYHRKSKPAERHGRYTSLDPADQRRVSAMAALLRIADALDRQHLQLVDDLEAVVADGVLSLRLEGEGDLLLERWAVSRKTGLFRDVFGVAVEVESEAGSGATGGAG